MITVCLHGAESTGKSVLAAKLGYPWVPEYGRAYCEERGVDIAMADLLAIAQEQHRLIDQAVSRDPPVLIIDTDALMTAAWAQMLFGEVPDALMAYGRADHYLLFAADVPWIADGTRFFGDTAERARFAGICEDMLRLADVTSTHITGSWAEREAQVRAVITGICAADA